MRGESIKTLGGECDQATPARDNRAARLGDQEGQLYRARVSQLGITTQSGWQRESQNLASLTSYPWALALAFLVLALALATSSYPGTCLKLSHARSFHSFTVTI